MFRQIDDSDCIVVLLTRDGVRSTWVQHEIGYALAKPKLILPLVEKGTDPTDLGALAGKDYIEYDPHRYDAALITASSYVKSLKLKKEEQAKALLVAGGILAFLLLLSGRAEMNSISYIPSKDQLALRLAPSRGKATWESARFRLWWDNQGNISGIDISLESSSDKS